MEQRTGLTIASRTLAGLALAACGEDEGSLAKAEFDATVEAAAEGDQVALVAMESEEDPFADIDRRLREYGLLVCGQDG